MWLLLAGLVAVALVVSQQQLKLLTVQTGSMRPGIDPGDLVAVTRVPADTLALGDVVTYTPYGADYTITHRIVAIDEELGMVTTKGDSNPSNDQPIDIEQLFGVVNYTVPFGGYIVDFVKQPIGLVLLIYMPALVIVISEVRRLAMHFKRIQPYLLPSDEPRFQPPLGFWQRTLRLASHLLAVVVIAGGVTMPAWAQLFDSATLAGNTISVLNEVEQPTVLLRRLVFTCSISNTNQVNRKPEIDMYNLTKGNVDISGWYLRSSSGEVMTFPPSSMILRKRTIRINPYLEQGLKYNGDYLALYDANNRLVDAISWGTDTTFLNPALPTSQAGMRFKRVPKRVDTNSADDWNVSQLKCPNNPHNGGHPNDPGECWILDMNTSVIRIRIETNQSSSS